MQTVYIIHILYTFWIVTSDTLPTMMPLRGLHEDAASSKRCTRLNLWWDTFHTMFHAPKQCHYKHDFTKCHKVSPWQRFCVYRDCPMLRKMLMGITCIWKQYEDCHAKFVHDATGFVDPNSTNSSNIGAAAGQEMLPLLFRCQHVPVIVSIQRCWAWRHGRFPHYVQRLHRWRLNCLQKDPTISVSNRVLTPKTVCCVHCVHFAWKVCGCICKCVRVVGAQRGPASMWAGERVHGGSSQKGRSNLTLKYCVFFEKMRAARADALLKIAP